MNNQIEIYQSPNGQTQIEVKFEQETVWLNQKQMAELFDIDSDTISLHLKNIYKDEELGESSTTENSLVVQQKGAIFYVSGFWVIFFFDVKLEDEPIYGRIINRK